MAGVGVREMRVTIGEAQRAETLATSEIERGYCQGVQDALEWAATGDPGAGLTAMRSFLVDRHASGRAWVTPPLDGLPGPDEILRPGGVAS